MPVCVPLISRQPKPSCCFLIAPLHSGAVPVACAQIVLRIGVSFFSSKPIPFYRFIIVLLHPKAEVIAQAKVALSICVSLFGSQLVPLHRLFKALLHSVAVFIAQAKIDLSVRISLFSSKFIPFHRFCVAFCYSIAVFVAYAQIILCVSKASIRRKGIPLHRFCAVPKEIVHQTYAVLRRACGKNGRDADHKHCRDRRKYYLSFLRLPRLFPFVRFGLIDALRFQNSLPLGGLIQLLKKLGDRLYPVLLMHSKPARQHCLLLRVYLDAEL